MHFPKQMQTRSVVFLLICLVILAGTGGYIVRSASTPMTDLTDLYFNAPMQQASYIIGIYTNPDTCYLQNGTTGNYDTTGTFYACLDTGINALTSGGKILIRAGNYTLGASVNILRNSIYLEGEGQGLSGGAYGQYGTQIWYSGVSAAIRWGDGASTHYYFGGIKDIMFHGANTASSYGTYIASYFSDLIFENCGFLNFDDGAYISSGTTGTSKVWNIWFDKCLFEDNTRFGVIIWGGNDVNLRSIDRVKITNCHFYDNQNSLYCYSEYTYHVSFIGNSIQSERQASINVTAGGRQWIISENQIFDCGIGANGTLAGIFVNGTGTLYPDSWLIENNIIANHFTGAPLAMAYGLYLTGTITNFEIQGNFFYGSSSSILMTGIASNQTIRFNNNLDYADSSQLRNFDFHQGSAINMTLWAGTAFPSGTPIAGQPYYRTDLYTLYVYNGTAWATVGATGPTGSPGTVYGLPFQYLVFKNSTATYMVNGTTSTIDYSSTNSSAVLNFALGNTSSGLVYVKSGTYSLDHGITVGRKVHLMGEGELNTILQMTASGNCITIDPTDTEYDWSVEQLQVDMNGQNGNGIYGSHMTTTSAKGISKISHVRVDDVQAGYVGIWAQDLIKAHWDTIMVRTYGTGYLFTRTLSTSFNFGDSQFDDLQCRILSSNVVGFNISGYSLATQNQSMNIALFNHPYVYATSSAYTNTIGIWIYQTQYVTMNALDVENCEMGIGLYQARDIGFLTPWIVSSGAAHIGVQLNSTTGGVNVFGGEIKTGGLEWDDDSSWNRNALVVVNFADTPSLDTSNTDVIYGTH